MCSCVCTFMVRPEVNCQGRQALSTLVLFLRQYLRLAWSWPGGGTTPHPAFFTRVPGIELGSS